MPKDVKVGLILIVGVVVVCGAKRISLGQTNAVADGSGPVKAVSPKVPIDEPNLDFPKIDLDDEASKGAKSLAKQSDNVTKELSKRVDDVKTSSDDSVAKFFPDDLREKVKDSSSADTPLGDLELPNDFGKAAAATSKTANDRPALSERKRSLPPVNARDVAKERSASSGGSDLTLPDLDQLNDSKSGPVRPTSLDDDLPGLLPEPSTINAGGSTTKGPVHPYFLRFIKEGSYYVRDGDSLRSIAYNLYQDESKAAEILELNRSTLKSASDLQPGMRLRLPKS